MTEIRRKVRHTQQRLWANRWFTLAGWSATAAIGAFGLLVLVTKVGGWELPLGWIVLGLLAAAMITATVWSLYQRADEKSAAAALDEAAGLRERISSGLYCEGEGDPFAQSVLADADRVSSTLSVGRHIPLRAPRALWYAAGAAAVTGILLLLPSGWIERSQVQAAENEPAPIERRQVEVKKRIDDIRKSVKIDSGLKDNPAMKDLVAGLEKLSQEPPEDPDAQRHEALKKIDKAADALQKQRTGAKFDKVAETKKMLRAVKTEGDKDSAAQKLSESLARGDFKGANEAIEAMQRELASMKDSSNAEAAQKMQEQLDRLSKQLAKAADDKSLEEKLEQAGIQKEDVKRLAEQAAKGETSELEQQLAKHGLTQPQIDSLMNQIQKRAAACSACRNMGDALSQAASSMKSGQLGDASSGLEAASGQLSEMEQLEQEMNQLDSMMESLQDAKGDMESCSACQGTGMQNGQPCSACQGSGMKEGAGLGKLGRGRGGLAPEQETAVGFKRERTNVFTGPGKIIGQFLVKGEQVKGEASSELVEIIDAEERNATDAINRDRIPRQYQKSVKEYFTRVQKALGREPSADEGSAAPEKAPAETE